MDDYGSNIGERAHMGPRDRWAQAQANALFATLICGVIGAIALAALTLQFAPDWLVEAGLVGFICGAVVYGFVAAKWARVHSPDEYANGNARTEAEVRQALADIQARKK